MRRILLGLVAALGLGACGTGTAAAQGFNPWPTPPGGNTTQHDNAVAGTLTADGLYDVLSQASLNPERKTGNSGKPYFKVAFQKGTWKLHMTVQLTADNGHIWLSAMLVDLPEADRLPPARLLRLLQENNQIVSQFTCSPDGKRLFLERALTNHGITVELFRKELDLFAKHIIDTKPLWDEALWASSPPGGGRPSGAATVPAPWAPYTSSPGRFRVLLPGQPTLQSQEIPGLNGQMHMHLVEYRGNGYMVGYVDFPASAVGRVNPETMFDSGRDAILRMEKTRLVSERPINRAGHPGREIIVEMDGKRAEWQCLLVGNRLYVLGAVAEQRGVDPSNARLFFDSFQASN